MFKIFNGREAFYQWDLNQKLIVNDNTINEVHFCNRTDDCSLVCEVYEADGLRLVDVPNILLQDTFAVKVYAVCEDYTKLCATYKVLARTKPADYVYTETEVKTWEALEKKIEEGITDEKIEEVVTDYLAANPPKAGVTSWNELEDKPFGEVERAYPLDMLSSDYVYISYDDGYGEFNAASIKDLVVGEYYIVYFEGVEYCCQCKEVKWKEEGATITQYITVKYLGNAAITGEYCTDYTGEPFLIEHQTSTAPVGNNISHIYTEDYYYGYETCIDIYSTYFEPDILPLSEVYIPSTIARTSQIPKKVSQLTNDAGYLTEHQSLEGYALKTDIPTLDGYATEQYVDEAIAGIDTSGSGGSGDGGAEAYYLPWWTNQLTDEDKAFLEEYLAYYNTNGKLKPVDVYFYIGTNYYKAINILASNEALSFFTCQKIDRFDCINYSFTSGSYSGGWQYEYGVIDTGGWTWTSTNNDSSLYNANEIYIMAYDNDSTMFITSHVILPEAYDLYEYVGRSFTFTTPKGIDYDTPYWSYDGSEISISSNSNSGYEIETIAYKQ